MIVNDLIYLNEPEHGHAIAHAAGGHFNEACDRVIARVRDGKLLGGVVFDHYNEASICIHTASFAPLWVNRDLLWATFHYPFVQLGVKKLFGQVNESNAASIKFVSSVGFTVEARIKDVFPDGDLLLFSMYREDCRWLDLKPRGVIANRYALGAIHG
jgi:RimJ/RimL family protein N-acetyltransferase